MAAGDLQYADLADILLDAPEVVDRRWCGEALVRVLQTSGNAKYRWDQDRDPYRRRTPAALETLGRWVQRLEGTEQDLLLRVLLLVPWEHNRRDTGLAIRAADAVQVLVDKAESERLAEAMAAVLRSGREAVEPYARGVTFPECRRAIGLEFEIDTGQARRRGVRPRRVVFDQVYIAVKSFHAYKCASNYRAIVPRWLDSLDHTETDDAVGRLLEDRTTSRTDRDRFVLLGLVDWVADHPEHPGMARVLEEALAGNSGAVRKAGAELAARVGRTDCLERMATDDPDAGVRKRARALLRGPASLDGGGGGS